MASIISTVSGLIRAYNLPRKPAIYKTENPYTNQIPEGAAPDRALYYSTLGTPVVADLTFEGGSYTRESDGRVVTYESVVLTTCLIMVTRPKMIIKTNITGGEQGSVKEYISLDDFQVSIQGLITGSNGRYPFEEVAALQEICDAPVSIPVTSYYLQNLKIFNLVVDDYSFEQQPGSISQQPFTINCSSDMPIALLI